MTIQDTKMESIGTNDEIHCEKYHLYFLKSILMDDQLVSKLMSRGFLGCGHYMHVVRKIATIFHWWQSQTQREQSDPIPLAEPPSLPTGQTYLFNRAILYDQYLIDEFIFPLFKYCLDHEFDLFIQKGNAQNNWQNILYVLTLCVDMQNNISRMIELVKQFIQNYENKTFKHDYDWTNVTIEQRTAKLKTVEQNLLELNFDMIDDLFKKWFEKSLEVWKDINLASGCHVVKMLGLKW